VRERVCVIHTQLGDYESAWEFHERVCAHVCCVCVFCVCVCVYVQHTHALYVVRVCCVRTQTHVHNSHRRGLSPLYYRKCLFIFFTTSDVTRFCKSWAYEWHPLSRTWMFTSLLTFSLQCLLITSIMLSVFFVSLLG
jgi:hypothetical protein